jgi:hypothetical protein
MMRAIEGEDQGSVEAIISGKKDAPVKPVAETKPVTKPVEPKPTAEAPKSKLSDKVQGIRGAHWIMANSAEITIKQEGPTWFLNKKYDDGHNLAANTIRRNWDTFTDAQKKLALERLDKALKEIETRKVRNVEFLAEPLRVLTEATAARKKLLDLAGSKPDTAVGRAESYKILNSDEFKKLDAEYDEALKEHHKALKQTGNTWGDVAKRLTEEFKDVAFAEEEAKPVAKPVEPKPTAEPAKPAPYKQNTTTTPLPLALPAPKPVAKPVTPTAKPKPKPATPAVEAVKTQNATAQVKKIVQTQVAQAQVKPVSQVGASQVVLQTQGPLAASTRENLDHTQSVLGIKDHLTLKMNGTRISTADKRYIVTGKAGKYDVVMQAHASPYTGQIIDQRVVAIVPTLEHAQLCIREFDNLQRSLAELEGVNTSANLQASAPVMAPQQIAQVATQLAQANAQNPVPPVTSPKTQAEVHPQFNACVVGLSKLRIPQALAKELVTNAVNALGSKAGVAEIVAHALHANQVTAAQIAHANQVFVATANQTTGQPNPNGIHQVVVLPSLAGLNAACGAVVPRPPTIAGLGWPPNSIPSPVQNATKPIWVPTAESLERFNRLIRFNRYSNKVKLPNGAEGIGTTLVNDLGYTIMQTSPSKFRLFAPNKMLISVADNEQQACDDLLKHHFKK